MANKNNDLIYLISDVLNNLGWNTKIYNNVIKMSFLNCEDYGLETYIELGAIINPITFHSIKSFADIMLVFPKSHTFFLKSFVKNEDGSQIENHHFWSEVKIDRGILDGYYERPFCYTIPDFRIDNPLLKKVRALNHSNKTEQIAFILAKLLNSYVYQFFNFQMTSVWEDEITKDKPLTKERWKEQHKFIDEEYEIYRRLYETR